MGLFYDIDTLREMVTFVYDANGRPDAIAGKHDDLLFSDMIANEIRAQQPFSSVGGESTIRVKWRADQYEDYRNAGAEEKAYLLKKWGNPFEGE
jgi:hypothetical protein